MSAASHYLRQIENSLGESWLPRIYRRILDMRTRSYEFPPLSRNAEPQIHHTLLGIEIKTGRRRMSCPDLATARYLAVFARLQCRRVAIPYDITKISLLADELDNAWHRMLLLVDEVAGDRSEVFRARLRRQLIGKVREEIANAGAGPRIPEFSQTTKQTFESQKGTRRRA